MIETIKPPSDMVLALRYISHIQYPCVEPVTGKDARDFWVRLARETLPFMRNPIAKSLLEDTITQYGY